MYGKNKRIGLDVSILSEWTVYCTQYIQERTNLNNDKDGKYHRETKKRVTVTLTPTPTLLVLMQCNLVQMEEEKK